MIRESRWRQRAPLAGPRQQHAAAVVKQDAAAADQKGLEKALLGVFSGSCQEEETGVVLASCELYDVSQDRSEHSRRSPPPA
ncbi:unnamed protein product [Dibothriocephalus latus]|uniref:Uncharacterized protein n=1 Tax=Dibothriocephalus latus TaxID=60516 RepID=A0A3P7LXB2_DIBLA|nr:unnamed protein product [Dibothriocephalus latus]